MATIVVTYQDRTTATVNSNTIAVTAYAGGSYKHSNKAVSVLDIDLSTSPSAVIQVTSSGSTMPSQTCLTTYGIDQTGPFEADWEMSGSATVGSMTITIPSSTNDDYYARMEIASGSHMDINIAR
jgi:hypothetical protein